MHRSSSSHAASSSPAPGQASASSAAAAAASPQTASAPADIADLPAKLELLEAAGIARAAALQRYTPFLCSPAHHIAVRLAFLQSRGKLRQPPRLYQVGSGGLGLELCCGCGAGAQTCQLLSL